MSIFDYRHEVWWFGLALLVPLGLAVRILNNPTSKAERSFGWMLLAECAWIFGQAAEVSLSSREAKLFADGFQYLPMCMTALLQLEFAHGYSGRRMPAGLRLSFLAVCGPLCLLFLTAPLHELVRTDAHIIVDEPFNALHYDFQLGDNLLIVVSLVAALYALGLIIGYISRVDPLHATSSIPVAVGLTAPILLSYAFSLTELRVLGQRDLSFVFFGIGGLGVLWGTRHRRAIVTIPVARDRIFDSFPDAAIAVSDSGSIIELNAAAAKLLGFPRPNQAIGAQLGEVECGTAIVQAASGSGVFGPDAEGRYREVLKQVVEDLNVTLLVVRDVTERERARRLLEENQETLQRKFRAVFENTVQLTGVLDTEGRVLEANRAALELVDTSVDEVVGQPFWHTKWWSHSSDLQREIERAVGRARRGETVRFEATHPDARGGLRQVDFSLKPLLSDDGEVTMLIAEGRDITDLRQTEEKLQQAQKMESLGRLAGGVAHDFNNLLTVMSGNLSIVVDTTTDPGAHEALDQVEQAIDSAASLTYQLLAFGRKSLVMPRSLDVKEHLEQQVSMLRRIIPENITIESSVSTETEAIFFDPAQLQQIILNLAVNAKHAMPDGGKLSFHCAPDPSGSFVKLEVSDTGTGMDPAHLAHIFEPFFTTKSVGNGTGLGLSMVYGALKQQGGRIEVSSELGRGSCFTLYFPLAKVQPQRVGPDSARVPSPGTDWSVYVVEDEEALRTTISRLLSRSGFKERTFASGKDLLSAFAALPEPDLLITDAVMPEMSGYDLLEAVRARWPNVATLVMSGYSEDQRLKEAVSLGVNFIPKPFTRKQLIEAMQSAVETRSENARAYKGVK